MNGGPTIYDVASAAGVSIATVSHTMNRPARVGEETRKRVLAEIDRLGYVPHAVAVHRARTKALRVGVIAPFTSYASFGTRLQGVLRLFAGTAHEVLVYDHDSVSRISSPRLAMLPVSGQLDGLIVMGIPLDDDTAERLLARRIPTVLVDGARPEFSSIVVDDERGGYLAGRRLIERGASEFLYVSEGQVSRRYVSPGQRRMHGVIRALGEAGLPPETLRHVAVGPTMADARKVGAALATVTGTGTGIVAHHDGIAAGLVAGLRSAGRDVPGEFAVVGFDGGPVAEAAALTTIVQPLARSGTAGAEVLAQHMRDPETPVKHVTLGVELSEGATA
ncbi:LacI family DNA-binding transcriptional regulator [Agromyces archimandritae]|uniref:LacI family DNA-binding transcriptional regulator n=1 Tax=Agromyces archimandritae TaxID=2781962 RepID=A0A975IPH2_9MICO|nr:LacI family DNA-binding transcriptional regulator [Agromyces archimandritae]QTX05633.1 LacI family DNA-binding transcriptional regulator [Agromyces archimandritae]